MLADLSYQPWDSSLNHIKVWPNKSPVGQTNGLCDPARDLWIRTEQSRSLWTLFFFCWEMITCILVQKSAHKKHEHYPSSHFFLLWQFFPQHLKNTIDLNLTNTHTHTHTYTLLCQHSKPYPALIPLYDGLLLQDSDQLDPSPFNWIWLVKMKLALNLDHRDCPLI